ncbi:MAG: hypothetical protein IPK39_16260 [Sulfuritalea sp.]|nr:hypothetical protein [Sulfuritalea sp.]
MAAKRILLLDGPVLTAHCWSGGEVKVEGEFSREPVRLEALVAYLKKHHSSLFYLLADIAEEGYQLEDLPYVKGADRTALLQRRLSQYYYNTPLSTAISLGRAKEGRRDERLLFAALTRIETFTPWLDALREAEATLAGVYSVPLVLAEWVPQLLGASGPVLFVSLSRGGVRQTFFDQGKLHFSRLSQLATHSLDEMGRTSASDAARIFQYLSAQRQLPRGGVLRTVVLAHAGEIPALQNFCRDTAELRFEFIDLVALARQKKLKEVPADSNAEKLLVHSLATKTPAQQFAPASETRLYKLWQIRFALTSAAWMVFASCMLFAGKTLLNVYQLRDTSEAARALTRADDSATTPFLRRCPRSAHQPRQPARADRTLRCIAKTHPADGALLLHLSQALNDTPRIELVRLTWKTTVDRPDAGSKPAAGAESWAVVEIQARLPLGLASNRRAQLELIESFAARLRDPRTDVRVLSRPFDIESDKALKNPAETGEVQLADVPKFSLRIAQKM